MLIKILKLHILMDQRLVSDLDCTLEEVFECASMEKMVHNIPKILPQNTILPIGENQILFRPNFFFLQRGYPPPPCFVDHTLFLDKLQETVTIRGPSKNFAEAHKTKNITLVSS